MSIRRQQEPPSQNRSMVFNDNADMSVFAELSQDEHKVVALGIEPGKLKPLQHLNEAAYKQHVRAGNFTKELVEQIEAHKRIATDH